MSLALVLALLLIAWLLWLIFRSGNPAGNAAEFVWWVLFWWWYDGC